jgi:hypothetical protein
MWTIPRRGEGVKREKNESLEEDVKESCNRSAEKYEIRQGFAIE